MEEMLEAISNVGFPIAVAIFVLIRIEPKLSKLIEAITRLVPLIEQETQNGNEIKQSLVDFRIEVGKINGKK